MRGIVFQITIADATTSAVQFVPANYPINENEEVLVCIQLDEGIEVDRELTLSYEIDSTDTLLSAGRQFYSIPECISHVSKMIELASSSPR